MREFKRLWETLRNLERLQETLKTKTRDFKRFEKTLRDFNKFWQTLKDFKKTFEDLGILGSWTRNQAQDPRNQAQGPRNPENTANFRFWNSRLKCIMRFKRTDSPKEPGVRAGRHSPPFASDPIRTPYRQSLTGEKLQLWLLISSAVTSARLFRIVHVTLCDLGGEAGCCASSSTHLFCGRLPYLFRDGRQNITFNRPHNFTR